MLERNLTSSATTDNGLLVSFDTCDVVEGQSPILVVTGFAPCLDMWVSLQPVAHASRPDYWKIEVVACLPTTHRLVDPQPFQRSLPLSGVIGSKGIEIVGDGRSERVNVAVPLQPSRV